MNPAKVDRACVKKLTDLPNIGKAMAADLHLLDIHSPQDLVGRDPIVLYQQLSRITQMAQDPCVLDVFMSVVDFMNGGPPRPWWEFTPQRKASAVSNKTGG